MRYKLQRSKFKISKYKKKLNYSKYKKAKYNFNILCIHKSIDFHFTNVITVYKIKIYS